MTGLMMSQIITAPSIQKLCKKSPTAKAGIDSTLVQPLQGLACLAHVFSERIAIEFILAEKPPKGVAFLELSD